MVAWADRIAYVCHDFEDAVSAGVVAADDLPDEVSRRCGQRRSQQIATFVDAVVEAPARSGQVAMTTDAAEALAAFRAFDYERIYLRPDSVRQAEAVIAVLRGLVEHLVAHPERLPTGAVLDDPVPAAVTYVAGMTDRFACRRAVEWLDWPPDQLPRGVDVALAAGRRDQAGRTSTSLRPWRSPNLTLPSARAKSVSSPPLPTFSPGWMRVPRWRTMIVPAVTTMAVVGLDAEALALRVAAVAGGAAALGLGHG